MKTPTEPLADDLHRKLYVDPNPAVQKELEALLALYGNALKTQEAEAERVDKENGIFGSKYPDHVALPWVFNSGREPIASFLLLELARMRVRIQELENSKGTV